MKGPRDGDLSTDGTEMHRCVYGFLSSAGLPIAGWSACETCAPSLGDRGRSQCFVAARLTLFAPTGSESAHLFMRNLGSFGLQAADFSAGAAA